MPNFTFKKEEKLKSRSTIARLFKEGQSFGIYPLRIIWVEKEKKEGDFPVQFALSVPKKKFRKAVHRNWLRRRVREAYRLHKHQLYHQLEHRDKQYAIMILFTGKEAFSYPAIEKSMKIIIKKFLKKIK